MAQKQSKQPKPLRKKKDPSAATCEIVKKSNALARARWSAESVWEPRLVALLASKVTADDTDFQVYELPVAELIEKSEKQSSGRTYLELAAVVERVMSRVITIKDEPGKGWTKYNVFSRCRYRFADGILELRFDPDLKVHFLNLQKNFAQYNLLEYLMLPSIYSQRIFEILKSWAGQREITIALDDLHEMLDTPDSLRNDFAQFRRRVLEKAHKDIHEDTSLSFDWEPLKKGRTVVAIRFYLGPKRLAAQKNKKKEPEKKTRKPGASTMLAANNCAIMKQFSCDKQDNAKAVCAFCVENAICGPENKKGYEKMLKDGLLKGSKKP
jgi:Protein involved in initiation of plasmid replication